MEVSMPRRKRISGSKAANLKTPPFVNRQDLTNAIDNLAVGLLGNHPVFGHLSKALGSALYNTLSGGARNRDNSRQANRRNTEKPLIVTPQGVEYFPPK